MSDHDDEADRHACDAHAYEAGQPTPAQDLEIARRALDRDRDARHALHHVACALAIDPAMPEALAMAHEIFSSLSDPLALVTLGRDAYYGKVALRALALRRMGRLEEALDLLLAVIATRPDVPFSAWLDEWTDEATLASMSPQALAGSIEGALRRLERAPVEDRLRALAHEPLASLARRAHALHPDHASLGLVASRAVRIAGHAEEAIAIARDVEARSPSFTSAVILGGALRVRGDLEGALAAFRTALARSPSELAIRLDVGDVLLELGRPDEAARAYDEVLAREPAHAWALPSMLYARWLDARDPTHRDRLERLVEDDPSPRARSLLDAITPYHGVLPRRREAVIAALTSGALEAGSTTALGSLEAPSAIHVMQDVARERFGHEIPITAGVPEPDPRAPWGPIAHELWRYQGIVAHPVPPPPSAATVRAVVELASQRFHAIAWTRLAQRVGPILGVDAIEGLLGAMVHAVGPRPTAIAPWDWRFRCQVAAALLLAFVDEGWAESGRRRALLSLVHGPLDWTTTAGIVALTQLANEEPRAHPEVLEVFEAIAALADTPIALACAIEPVAHCRLQLPDLDDATLAAWRAARAELERA